MNRLSNLPEDLINQILSQMLLRDAVRTSVLSSQWRLKWTTLSSLVFKSWYSLLALEDQTDTMINKYNKLVGVIDSVFLLHSGPICKFVLSQRGPISTTDVDRWIIHLSRFPIREFKLYIWEGQRYKLHSSLFSYQDLVLLKLFHCCLKPPSTFGGFKKLKKLDFECVTMAQDVFENLICSCPMLERLSLEDCDGFTHLNIHAPNLFFLKVGGYFEDITLSNTSNLAEVYIGLYTEEGAVARKQGRNSNNLLNFFSSLPHLSRLEIRPIFLKYLATGNVPGQLLNPCLDLGYLSIPICLDDYGVNSAALCLLRSSPNLQELEIWGYQLEQPLEENISTIWEGEEKKCSFNQLQVVEISGISGNKTELEFIRFILLASPVLQKMTIEPCLEYQELGMTRELLGQQMARELLRLQVQPASGQAEVVFLHP